MLSKIAADNILKLQQTTFEINFFLSCQKIGFDIQIVSLSTSEKCQNLFSWKKKKKKNKKLEKQFEWIVIFWIFFFFLNVAYWTADFFTCMFLISPQNYMLWLFH